MSLRRARRLIFILAIAPTLLVGCGRKGPNELPPDVQAAREAQAAQQQAEAAKGGAAKLSEQGEKAELKPVPGEKGHRPPKDYPFPLDFLL